jgi:hypothetical protein
MYMYAFGCFKYIALVVLFFGNVLSAFESISKIMTSVFFSSSPSCFSLHALPLDDYKRSLSVSFLSVSTDVLILVLGLSNNMI